MIEKKTVVEISERCPSGCDSVQMLVNNDFGLWVECSACEMTGPVRPVREAAIAEWNRLPRRTLKPVPDMPAEVVEWTAVTSSIAEIQAIAGDLSVFVFLGMQKNGCPVLITTKISTVEQSYLCQFHSAHLTKRFNP